MLDRLFKLTENNTTVRTEFMAGLTTFLTMAYIIVVQPSVLSGNMFDHPTGMDFGAIMTATCLSAALATAIMGLYARYPIAQAPGMGENFFFVFSAVPAAASVGFANPWQVALGTVFISGILFLLLSIFGVREMIFNAISPSLKNGIAAGIGLFIAFIGLQNAGLIVHDPGTMVKLAPHFVSPDILLFLLGLVVTASLHARRVRGSILYGIVLVIAIAAGFKALQPHLWPYLAGAPQITGSVLMQRLTLPEAIVSQPPSLGPGFLKLDLVHALSPKMLPFILVFLFMLMFDAIGTLIGVCEQAGFMRDNKLPRARQAMISDAVGTVAGAAMGTSTVTSFIESAAGVEQGGRTGLTALVVAAFFLLAIFFGPVIAMAGSYPPATAPALVMVGAMMMRNATKIAWDDPAECIPAFITMVGIPLSFSIADGLALGFMADPAIKLCSGRGQKVGWLTYVLAVLLLAYFLFVRDRMP